ncbi:MAG: hypothetical protein J6R88_01725 [Clostridia bacterium]|nr:hypothetical protein [Clostridia bacterium]
MIKVKNVQFNILAFIIKTALLVVSVAVSIILLTLSEQNGVVLNGIEQNGLMLRNVFARPEATTQANVFGINEKALERVFSTLVPSFLLTKTIIFNVCKFIAFAIVGAIVIARLVILLARKNVNATGVATRVTESAVCVNTKNSVDFDSYLNLNVKLTI